MAAVLGGGWVTSKTQLGKTHIVEMDFEGNSKKRKRNPLPCIAANSSSDPPSAEAYEVFLSFRGGETRMGFTDFLYTDLVYRGIRTFRDDDELRVGEEIGPELLKAIQESKISIPIFSKNYASSKWCLLELAQIVECQRKRGQKILPIFYYVVSSDVQHQRGSYEEAFRQHKKRFDKKIVKGWKEALREVGGLKGWELEKETNRSSFCFGLSVSLSIDGNCIQPLILCMPRKSGAYKGKYAWC